jgi:hypothetical protein
MARQRTVIAGLDPTIHDAAPPSSPCSQAIKGAPHLRRDGHHRRRGTMDHRVKPGDDSTMPDDDSAMPCDHGTTLGDNGILL